MAYKFPPEVDSLVRKQMAKGQYESEDDVLREALLALRCRDEDAAAVKEAIADMEAGDRGVPFDEFVGKFRKQHNIPHEA